VNKRIQELAEEHGFIHEFMTTGERSDALQKYKKFAELIVQECVGVIEHNDLIGAKTEYYTKKIKQHLGVDQSAK
jgi:hypothetical protein